MSQFSAHIRDLRQKQKILQREVAAFLKTDTAFISKMEKGERRAKRQQVLLLAELFNVKNEELLSLWLAEKLYEVLKDEEVAKQALRVAESEITYNDKKKTW